jgi:hypothetical protein
MNTTLADELYAASGKINTDFKIWGPKECMEISGDLFWHDVQSDLRARTIAADLLNDKWNQSNTPEDTVIITSMEAIAAGNVVSWWNKAYKTTVNFAYVRGASNYDHVLLDETGLPVKSSKESWKSGITDEFVEKAALNASNPILKMLELRNLKK